MSRFTRKSAAVGVIAAAALIFSGCSSGEGGGAGGDSNTLRYMSYWTDGEPTSDIMKEAFADFTEETGIDVEVTWQGRDLPEVLTPVLAASSPTVDMIDFGCAALNGQVSAFGKAADLSSVLDAEVPGADGTVKDIVSADALKTGVLDGTQYCLPFEMTSNFDIWVNNATNPGIADAPPETWDEFKALLDEAGPGSIALDGTIAPYAQAWYLNLAVSAAGAEGVLDAALDKTGEAFNDPAFLQAAEVVEDLVNEGHFADGYAASKFPAIQQKWANNDAQFLLNGSWIPAEVAPYAAEGFEYASFPFPAIDEDGVRPMQIDTIGFAAIEGAANTENAKKFMSFFLQSKYQDQIGQIAVPAVTDADIIDSLAYVQRALADESVVKIAANDGTAAAIPGWGQDVFDPLAQKLALGDISADDFISELVSKSKAFWDLQG